MIYAFLVDTSPSMALPFTSTLSLLDAAKASIEHFIKRASHKTFVIASYSTVTDTADCDTALETVRGLKAVHQGDAGIALQKLFEHLSCKRLVKGDAVGKVLESLAAGSLIYYINTAQEHVTVYFFNSRGDTLQRPKRALSSGSRTVRDSRLGRRFRM